MSEGTYVTFGLNESEDLDDIINYFLQKKEIKSFSLWGRRY